MTPLCLRRPSLFLVLLLLLLVGRWHSHLSAATIVLESGSTIQAKVLQEKEDRIDIDLGPMVISLPRDAVTTITEEVETATSLEDSATSLAHGAVAEGLFYTDADREPMNVPDNVARCGGAVVQVRSASGLGSGLIINERGYVVTNNHVISGERELIVTVYRDTPEGLERTDYHNIRILATSPFFDLALLQIDDPIVSKLPYVPIGDSQQLSQGQPVFAIGSPLGLERTVSQGIVSLRNRLIDGRVYIQSTAQINPGNSGGPLFNLRGQVVGVNNMKAALPGVEGLGFAIPSSMLKFFLLNREAFAFDPRNPNAGFRYPSPPGGEVTPHSPGKKPESTSSETSP